MGWQLALVELPSNERWRYRSQYWSWMLVCYNELPQTLVLTLLDLWRETTECAAPKCWSKYTTSLSLSFHIMPPSSSSSMPFLYPSRRDPIWTVHKLYSGNKCYCCWLLVLIFSCYKPTNVKMLFSNYGTHSVFI